MDQGYGREVRERARLKRGNEEEGKEKGWERIKGGEEGGRG